MRLVSLDTTRLVPCLNLGMRLAIRPNCDLLDLHLVKNLLAAGETRESERYTMNQDPTSQLCRAFIIILHSNISSLYGVTQELHAYIQQAHFKGTQKCKTSNQFS